MTVKRWIRKLRSEHESSEIIEPEQECPVRMIEIVPKQIEEDAEARSRDSGVQAKNILALILLSMMDSF